MQPPNALKRIQCRPCAETFRCPGGALCLDFCNTGQGARDRHGEEWLATYGDLVDWLEAAGALGGEQAKRLRRAALAAPESAARIWRRAIELREALQRAFEARAQGSAPSSEDLERFESEYAQGAALARLRWTGEHADWTHDAASSDLAAVLRPVVQSAAELLTSEKLSRMRRCGSPTCSWLFIDETRNGSRRWCEMASCGNLHKVRRHRERQSAPAARRKGARADRR